jgi:hypothetical protein
VSSEGPAAQPPRWRRFWKERSWKGKTAIIVGLVLLVLIVIGIAVPAPDDSENASAEATTPTTTSAPATTTEEATTSEATTEEAADTTDEDTGRMSEGEFEGFSNALTEVDQEVQQFGTTLQKCGVLFQALQLADGSDCVDEAYSGFEDKVSFAVFTVDDLKDDVANGCLQATTAYKARLNHFAAYVGALHDAGTNLQGQKVLRLSKRASQEAGGMRLSGTWRSSPARLSSRRGH